VFPLVLLGDPAGPFARAGRRGPGPARLVGRDRPLPMSGSSASSRRPVRRARLARQAPVIAPAV